MAIRGGKPTPEYLTVVEDGQRPKQWDDGRCGYPTGDDSPCERKADGRCWQHDDLPEPERESYPPPEHLGPHGRRCWRTHVDEAVRLGLLTQLDWSTFEKFCEAYEVGMKAWDTVQAEPTVIETSRGDTKKNPAITVWKDAADKVRMYASELGFTPTARSRIDLPEPEETEGTFERIKRGSTG